MIIGYKCPQCGSMLKQEPGTKSLVCDSCDFEISIFLSGECELVVDEELENKQLWFDETSSFHCFSCGAKINVSKEILSCQCKYCGTDMVIEEHLKEEYAPDKFIPFNVDRDTAIEKFREYIATRTHDPNYVMDERRVEGIYAPFWLYDFTHRAEIKGTGRRDHHLYDISRTGELTLEKIPLDASLRLSDSVMNAIMPFHYSTLYDFEKGALSGYSAEGYDYDFDEMLGRVRREVRGFMDIKLRNFMEDKLKDTNCVYELNRRRSGVGTSGYMFPDDYTNVSVTSYAAEEFLEDATFALLPVWIYSFKYKDKYIQLGINGQTGAISDIIDTGTIIDKKIKQANREHNRKKAIKWQLIGIGAFIIAMIVAVIISIFVAFKDVGTAKFVALALVAILTAVPLIWKQNNFSEDIEVESYGEDGGMKVTIKAVSDKDVRNRYMTMDSFELTDAKDVRIK